MSMTATLIPTSSVFMMIPLIPICYIEYKSIKPISQLGNSGIKKDGKMPSFNVQPQGQVKMSCSM